MNGFLDKIILIFLSCKINLYLLWTLITKIFIIMKFYCILKSSLFLAFVVINTTIFAQNNALLQEDIEFSRQWESKLNHATSPNHSDKNKNDKRHHSCLSLVLLEGEKNKKRLTSRLQKLLRMYDERPTLDFFLDSPHFRFHYDKTGTNAVSSTDTNNNQVPDYIEFMATEFENVYQKEIENLGFISPPSDAEEGGGQDLYDVYVTDLQQGLYGYVAPERTIGDNPNSPETETQAATSVLRVRNNYEGFGLQNDALKVTAAHEYFHAIQLGYNADTPSAFALEGSASWIEEEIYPRVDDNFQYLNSVFNNPDVAINYDFSDENDPDFFDFTTQWYGSWIFFQYIGENYGKEVVRIFWQNLRLQSELEAFDAALQTKNTNLNTVFEDFFVANIVLSSNSAANPFVYARAADYIDYLRENSNSERVRIEGTMNFSRQSTTWRSNQQGNNRLMRFSADYIELNTQEEKLNVEVLRDNLQESQIGIQFVALQSNGQVRVIKNYPNQGDFARIEVENTNPNDKMYLIVYRLGNLNDDFTSQQYTIRIYNPSAPLGIEDNLGANNYFKIASNPISDNLRFVYQLENQNIKDYKATITDVLGRKMISNKPIDEPITTSKWAKGTYFVTLLYNQKPLAIRKIIVE